MIASKSESISLLLEETTQVGEARRRAGELCRVLELNETAAGEAAIIVTELASNVIRHGGGGELLLRPAEEESGEFSLEILALDKGLGMADVGRSLSDGYSTGGTAGTGFGAVQRLAKEFAVQSAPGAGTAVLAVVRQGGAAAVSKEGASGRLGAVSVPKRGEDVCGDAWAVRREGGRTFVLVADGLGHGLHAAEASREAVRVFRDYPGTRPGELLEIIHGALRSTRGAAVAVAELNAARSELVYAGIGNIAGTIVAGSGGSTRSLVSHNGIVGHEMRRTQEFVYTWEPESLLVMASDGLGTQWNLSKHPGLQAKPAALIAGVLYRDHNRGRDDSTVVVIR